MMQACYTALYCFFLMFMRESNMLRSSVALLAVALALPQTYAAVNHKYQPIDTNYPVPTENVL